MYSFACPLLSHPLAINQTFALCFLPLKVTSNSLPLTSFLHPPSFAISCLNWLSLILAWLPFDLNPYSTWLVFFSLFLSFYWYFLLFLLLTFAFLHCSLMTKANFLYSRLHFMWKVVMCNECFFCEWLFLFFCFHCNHSFYLLFLDVLFS